MRPDKILSLLGLAMKAGRLASGETATEKEAKSGRAGLVIVAEDASENTKKKFRNTCRLYEIPYYEYSTKEQLGSAIGKEQRSSLAVLDAGFAESLIKHLNTGNKN